MGTEEKKIADWSGNQLSAARNLAAEKGVRLCRTQRR